MPKKINDKFAKDKRLSRQARYQKRHLARRLCALCPNPAMFGGTRCIKHLNRKV